MIVHDDIPSDDAAGLYKNIANAHQKLRPQVRVTPLDYSAALSRLTGCDVYLKCEHLQHTGSFKFRGASYKLLQLGDRARQSGVITASSGNHGQSVARAGKQLDVSVTVYVPSNIAAIKLETIRAFGAHVKLVDGDALAAELEARRQSIAQNAPYISPYNDLDVIAGQGMVAMEMLEQQTELDAVFVAVGGGGLISGIGTVYKAVSPQTKIFGCWPANAGSMHACLLAGDIIAVKETDTISDGTAGGVEPEAVTFPICQNVIDQYALLSEGEIKAAMKLIAETERWIIEGAAGVALAGLLQFAPNFQGRKIAAVLCGRNIGLQKYLSAIA